jgi:hypothetical protein
MSEIKVNKISPRTNCGTTQLGDSGDTFTLPSGGTLTIACGATITNNGTQTGFGRTGTVDWQTTVKTGDFTAASGEGYFVNTTSGAVTVTLPSSPSAGDIVAVKDYANTWDTNACTLARNGSNIGGDASNSVISTEGLAVTLVYVDATKGWLVTDSGLQSEAPGAEFVAASGGNSVLTCGDHKVHIFTGPGTFTVSNGGNAAGSNAVDYLVVAGGGSGGSQHSGGGGAGGVRFASCTYTVPPTSAPLKGSQVPVTAQAYPITVGGGAPQPSGPPWAYSASPGAPGNPSTFSTITSTGGGKGGGYGNCGPSGPLPTNDHGGPGGSGGGAGSDDGVGGSGNTPPVAPAQGKDGGDGAQHNTGGGGGGGGGGAGACGADAVAGPSGGAGNGGNGLQINICGPSNNYYWGGGGGGGTIQSAPNGAGNGGLGGGGGGGSNCGPPSLGGTGGGSAINNGSGGGVGSGGSNQGGNAGVNSGGGGGGSGSNTSPAGAGGSGIVIIRYKFQ